MKTLVLILFTLSLAPLVSAGTPPLRDQYGNPGGLDPACRHQLVIVVSAARLRRLGKWERKLVEQFPDLHVVRVADIPRTSPTDYDTVAGKLRKRLPKDVNVLIDLNGAWATRYSLDTSVPNLLLFQDGVPVIRHAGMYRRSLFQTVTADFAQQGVTCAGEPPAAQ